MTGMFGKVIGYFLGVIGGRRIGQLTDHLSQ
jgi:hypothetical protein